MGNCRSELVALFGSATPLNGVGPNPSTQIPDTVANTPSDADNWRPTSALSSELKTAFGQAKVILNLVSRKQLFILKLLCHFDHGNQFRLRPCPGARISWCACKTGWSKLRPFLVTVRWMRSSWAFLHGYRLSECRSRRLLPKALLKEIEHASFRICVYSRVVTTLRKMTGLYPIGWSY